MNHCPSSDFTMKKYFISLVLFIPALAIADCWSVSDLKGYSVRDAEKYEISNDGFSGQAFELSINKNEGSVSPSNMKCRPTTARSLVCIDQKDGLSTIETWAVSPETGKAFHTKSINGYGRFDGANLFVGKLSQGCKRAE
jgi:hypothetical protein